MPNSANRHFTLIELIVVIVLIMIIVGMTVPSFNRILHGNAVDHGASMVASILNLARVEACAKEQHVAVIFADQSTSNAVHYSMVTSGDDKELDEIYNKRAMRCCYVTVAANGAYTFVEWVPNTKWDLIPIGAIFDFRSSSKYVGSNSSDGNVIAVTKTDEEGELRIYGDFRHFIVFDTVGVPINGNASEENTIQITEGVYSDNTDLDSSNPVKKNDDNYLRIVTRRYTGDVFVKQR